MLWLDLVHGITYLETHPVMDPTHGLTGPALLTWPAALDILSTIVLKNKTGDKWATLNKDKDI